jgi:hypothetical protein
VPTGNLTAITVEKKPKDRNVLSHEGLGTGLAIRPSRV